MRRWEMNRHRDLWWYVFTLVGWVASKLDNRSKSEEN